MTVAVNTTTFNKTDSVTLGANSDFVIINTQEYASMAVQIITGLTGTVTYTASLDGVNFASISGATTNNPGTSSSLTGSDTNPTSAAIRVFDVTTCNFFRVQITSYGSGSCLVYWMQDNSSLSPLASNFQPIIVGVAGTSLGKAEDAVHASADTGVAVWGVRNDTGVTSPTSTDGDYSYIAVDAMGSPRVTAGKSGVTTSAHTVFRLAAAGTTNATSIKGTPGNVYAMSICNTSAAIKYVKFYNKASAPTVGTDTPVLVIGVPPTSTFTPVLNLVPIPFALGIAMATTTVGTDADATAVTANDLMITVYYA